MRIKCLAKSLTLWLTFILEQLFWNIDFEAIQRQAIGKCPSVTYPRSGQYIQQHCGTWQRIKSVFCHRAPTCAGVSVSLIGCPSNLNLIWRIAKPCKTQDRHVLKNQTWNIRQGAGGNLDIRLLIEKNAAEKVALEFSLASQVMDYMTWVVDPPVVRSMPSLTCWAECAFWFWTVRPTRLDPLL